MTLDGGSLHSSQTNLQDEGFVVTRGVNYPFIGKNLYNIGAFVLVMKYKMSPEMTVTLQKTIQVILCIISMFQAWVGVYLYYDQYPDLLGSFTGVIVTFVGLLIFFGCLSHKLALLALLQVILFSLEMLLSILIGLSVFFKMDDQLLLGLYVSGLLFLILESIILREHLILNYVPTPERQGYQDLDASYV